MTLRIHKVAQTKMISYAVFSAVADLEVLEELEADLADLEEDLVGLASQIWMSMLRSLFRLM